VSRELILAEVEKWGNAGDYAEEETPGKWTVLRGRYGASRGTLALALQHANAPELRIEPGVTGWHDVYVRVYHTGRDDVGVFAGTTRDRALRLLRPEMQTESFEELYLGPRDLADATIRLGNYGLRSCVDCVRLVPLDHAGLVARRALAPAEWEVVGILDFADAAGDYIPDTECAAEAVRVHAEAGFTTIIWKSFAVRCEFHSRVGDLRSAKFSAGFRSTVGDLLAKYDTLEAAAAAAKESKVRILGWLRINNETSARTGEWVKFAGDTRFHLAHPEMRQINKDGHPTPKLSFAYPEVREYLCAIGREVLDRGMDGLVIDVLRHPPMVRYDAPLVKAFTENTGQDPRQMEGDGTEEWLRFRATAFTSLLRDFRRMMDDSPHAAKPLWVRAHPFPWRLLRDGCDVDAWMKEGLVQTLVVGHHVVTGPGHPTLYDLRPIQDVVRARAKLIAQVMRFTEMHTAFGLARQAREQNADGVAIYESNAVVTYPRQRERIRRLRNLNS